MSISVRRNSKGHLAVFIAGTTARMLVKPDRMIAWWWTPECAYPTPTAANAEALIDLIRYHLASVKLIKIHEPTSIIYLIPPKIIYPEPSYIYVSLSDEDLLWLHLMCEN